MPKTEQLQVKQATGELEEQMARFKTAISSKCLQSDLDLLRQHYQLNRSYFSRFADGYAQRPWWQKLLVGMGVIGTALALTAVLCATSVITVATCIGVNLLVLAFYISTAALLTNHAAMETKRFESIAAQVMRFERDLQATIQSFQVIEERLATLLHSLHEQQGILDNYAAELSAQVAHLNEELAAAKGIIANLTQVMETLQTDTTSQQILGQALTGPLQTLHTVILSDTDKVVNEISNQLVGNAHELSETANLLKTINQTLTVYDSAFKAKLEALEEEMEATMFEVEQLNQDEEEFQALFTQNQTFCQQVSHQLQQSAARNLADQAFLTQFQTTATPQFPPSAMPQPR